MNGLINVYKEKGYTSFDVVAKMRGILKERRIGHTGTLDPEAEGVLVLCVGNATKIVDYLTDRRKEYIAEMRLGITTDTLDMTGVILSENDVSCTEEEVRSVVKSFCGNIMQVPPMYSALKVNGKKLCDLARSGIEVKREERPVTIYELEILEISMPVVKLRVLCSKGTYIRTLCDDIGRELGVGAAMQSLIRTKAAGYNIEDSLKLKSIEKLRDEGRLDEYFTGIEEVFSDLPGVRILDEYEKRLMNGNIISGDMTDIGDSEPGKKRMYHADGRFCGIFDYDGNKLNPDKIFEL